MTISLTGQPANPAARGQGSFEKAGSAQRLWVSEALSRIRAEQARSTDTNLLRLDLPQLPGVTLYFKDESSHVTGSLKHRLARSLFLHGLCNGRIKQGRPVIELSSGSTAISAAYFSRLIGVPMIAVVPRGTATEKIRQIERFGGRCIYFTAGQDGRRVAERVAAKTGGCFLDQFTFAERATDWRGENNIAECLFNQLRLERDAVPDWIVVGAGTGGTAATIGRYIRYRNLTTTRLCVVDPEHSALFSIFSNESCAGPFSASLVVEGVGRPSAEASFIPAIIDEMIAVPDGASLAALGWLEKVLGKRCGPSTGLNAVGALLLAVRLREAGKQGAIATLICDSGARYSDTVYRPDWVSQHGIDVGPYKQIFATFDQTGAFPLNPCTAHQE